MLKRVGHGKKKIVFSDRTFGYEEVCEELFKQFPELKNLEVSPCTEQNMEAKDASLFHCRQSGMASMIHFYVTLYYSGSPYICDS